MVEIPIVPGMFKRRTRFKKECRRKTRRGK
jgi:hypothetical protein